MLLDWSRIAESAGVKNGEIARSLVQAIFSAAVGCEREGMQVTLNLRIGRFLLANSDFKFTSQLFGNR